MAREKRGTKFVKLWRFQLNVTCGRFLVSPCQDVRKRGTARTDRNTAGLGATHTYAAVFRHIITFNVQSTFNEERFHFPSTSLSFMLLNITINVAPWT